MSIGGPSGVGGPSGPRGPSGPGGAGGPDGPDGPEGPDDVGGADEIEAHASIERADLADATTDIDRLAAEVAAGRLTPREAIDQLVESTATPELSAAERAELRQLMTDLIENDPYFTSLAGRI